MPKGIKRQPWHRCMGESATAYALFRIYFETDASERSLQKMAVETGRSYQAIAMMSSKNHWAERAAHYDAYLEQLQDKRVEQTLERDAQSYAIRRSKYRNREYTLSEKLLLQAEEMIDSPLYEEITEKTQEVTIGDQTVIVPLVVIKKPAGWNKATATKALKAAAEIMRLNLEMETQRIGVVNLSDPLQRLRYARASLIKQLEPPQLEKLIDQQMQITPTANRQEVMEKILQSLPYWMAEDWKLTEEQLPDLIEGINLLPPALIEEGMPADDTEDIQTTTDSVN